MKKILAFITAVMLLLTCLPAASFADSTPTVRWLNVKQEIAGQMEALAKLYTEKTGVNVIVETAVSGTYYTTLNARLDTRDAPSVFSLESQNVLGGVSGLLPGFDGYRIKQLGAQRIDVPKAGWTRICNCHCHGGIRHHHQQIHHGKIFYLSKQENRIFQSGRNVYL